MILRLVRQAAMVAVFGACAAMAQLPVVPGERALAPKSVAPAAQLRLGANATLARVELSLIADSEIAKVRAANLRNYNYQKRLVIGVGRSLAADALSPSARELQWARVAGGQASRVTVASPQAGALRLSIDLRGVPADVEMVFFGSAYPDRLMGPIRVGEIADRTAPWWSPLTEGDTQTVEFFVPAQHDPRALGLRILDASHVFATPSTRFDKRTQEIGSAGSCNVDVKCSALQSSPGFLDTRNAVAQMVFTDRGTTVLCTGTLLNDTDPTTQIAWFYSANHCFENEFAPYKTASEMQAVANTLNTLFFFEAVSCGSKATPPYVQLNSGAAFIYNNATADVLFLRLYDAPPAGAYFSGWDPNTIWNGASVVTLHHPQGDLKKVSQGATVSFSSPGVAGGGGSFIEVRWSQGTTEGGSSGAGLWTFDGSSRYLFRGGLWGGSALCTNPNGTDNFSRFDQVYPALAAYLNPAAAPATDYTDLWWNPNESGWGLNLVQHPSRIIFGVWYTYGADGKRTWYAMTTGSWTSANTYTGPLYSTSGPPFSAPFDPARVHATLVGNATLTFSDASNGTWTYSVNGISGSKAITRQPY